MKYISYVTLLACLSGIIFNLIAKDYLAATWAFVAGIQTINICLRERNYR